MFSCQIIHFNSATMTSPKWEITLSALTLIWLLLPLNCLCESSNGESILTTTSGSEQREFDLFVLALQWSGTICQRTYRCCPSNGCCRSSNAPSGFTIHGLWTDYNDGTWPSCCRGPRFDLKEIAPLLEGLQKYWPSLSCSGSSTCHGGKGLFWAHEWEKHGTCASSVLRDEYSYFLATINLYLKYNITEILIEAGYTPSNKEKYPLGGIISAIEVAVGATPLIVCSHGAIEELRICFYKNFQPRDCMFDTGSHSNTVASSSCPRYVSLPEYTHEWPWKRDNKNMITQSQSM